MNSGLRFFKLILTSQKMVIPTAVIGEMRGVERVALRDRYGNIWEVGVIISGDNDEWSFKEGWPHFYEDNCLKPYDFLVFEYKGGPTCVFDFKILGQNSCEKKGVSKFRIKEKCEVKEELKDDSDDEGEESEQVCESNQSDLSGSGKPTNNPPPFFISKLGSRKSELFIPKNVMVDYKLKLPEWLFLVDVHGNKWETVVKQWENGRVCCTGGAWRTLCNVNNITKGDAYICEFNLKGCQHPCILVRPVDAPAGTSREAIKEKYVCNGYSDDIFKQGVATRHKSPQYFVSRSRPRRNELGIPKEVIKNYKVKLPDALFLIDERGNKWKTNVKTRKDGRVLCSGGWRSLCSVNNIDNEDTCFCEVFLETDDPYILVRLLDETVSVLFPSA